MFGKNLRLFFENYKGMSTMMFSKIPDPKFYRYNYRTIFKKDEEINDFGK